MDEVDEIWVVGKRPQEAGAPVHAFGEEVSVHVGPGIRDLAGVESRNPGAEQELNEENGERDGRQPRQARRLVLPGGGEALQVQPDPDQRAYDRQREQQMSGEAEVADVGAVLESGFDHVPTERALQTAEDE